mmetsp:Transcript_38868/g.60598  ORF Transcript_38868/g.60598 Transcript_38868/m.60598 type:complete len:125 (-) Transcript_38868:47-421(-)
MQSLANNLPVPTGTSKRKQQMVAAMAKDGLLPQPPQASQPQSAQAPSSDEGWADFGAFSSASADGDWATFGESAPGASGEVADSGFGDFGDFGEFQSGDGSGAAATFGDEEDWVKALDDKAPPT